MNPQQATFCRPRRFISCAQLAADASTFAAQLPPTIDAIGGVARSGLIPASIIATILHRPLWTLDHLQPPLPCGHGWRMYDAPPSPTHMAIIDDTCSSGGSMRCAADRAREAWPNCHLTRCAIYSTIEARRAVDLYHIVEPGTHLLEWHFSNAAHTAGYLWDLDGIICEDFAGGEDEGPAYLEHLHSARPRWLPRRQLITGIVTARCEKYRPHTEAWLQRHGVRCASLWMGPWPSHQHRATSGQVPTWKAKVFGRNPAPVFVESCPHQAQQIAAIAGKPVLCPPAARLFP